MLCGCSWCWRFTVCISVARVVPVGFWQVGGGLGSGAWCTVVVMITTLTAGCKAWKRYLCAQMGCGGAVLAAARSWSVFQSFLVVCCCWLVPTPIHVGCSFPWFMHCVTFDTRPIWGLRLQKLCQICGDLGCYPPRQCEGSTLALAPPRVDKQGGDRVQHI